jgi:hypothetical protein
MAAKKDAAFYRKQRLDDEKKAKGGDKKAKAELAQIEKKREMSRGKSTRKEGPAVIDASPSRGKKQANMLGDMLNSGKQSNTAGMMAARSRKPGKDDGPSGNSAGAVAARSRAKKVAS